MRNGSSVHFVYVMIFIASDNSDWSNVTMNCLFVMTHRCAVTQTSLFRLEPLVTLRSCHRARSKIKLVKLNLGCCSLDGLMQRWSTAPSLDIRLFYRFQSSSFDQPGSWNTGKLLVSLVILRSYTGALY